MPSKVTIIDVSPWEGFLSDNHYTPFDKKIQYINLLTEAGVRKIIATSFVHPKVFPQFKDAERIMRYFINSHKATYIAPTPNEIGCRRALNAGVKEALVWVSVSRRHNMFALNATVEDTLQENQLVCEIFKENKIKVRSVIATAFGCAYEGKVPFSKLINIALKFDALECHEICLADTHGMANPRLVKETIRMMKKELPNKNIGVHFHDLRGMGVANAFAAFEEGIDIFDAAVGGIGFAPDIKRANIETNMTQLVTMFEEMGVSTGIDLEKLHRPAEFAKELFDWA